MTSHNFNNTQELLERARIDGACQGGLEWCEHKHLQEILRTIPADYRFWCLVYGYTQFAKHCDWSKLSGSDWGEMLSEQPQYLCHCDLDKLNDYYLCLALSRQPQLIEVPIFEERFDRAALSGWRWTELLKTQPQFSNRCNWSRLRGVDWSYLLIPQPQFSEECDKHGGWALMDSGDQTSLLYHRPQFVEECDTTHFNNANWNYLLPAQPQLAEYRRATSKNE